MALNGWHRGELTVHTKLNQLNNPAVASLYSYIDGDLPGDHAEFHSTRLSFLPIVTLDHQKRPWGSILAGPEGKRGFISSTKYSTLTVDAKVWQGDPLLLTAELFGRKDPMLAAGIGIELSTRRRNKFAGVVSQLQLRGDRVHLQLSVNQAIGYAFFIFTAQNYHTHRALKELPEIYQHS